MATTFEVSATREGGETVVLGTTDNKGLTVSNTLEDGNYTISVVAIVDGTRSEPGTTSFEISSMPDEDLGTEDPNNPDIEQPTPPDQGNGEDNGNNNGNGNTTAATVITTVVITAITAIPVITVTMAIMAMVLATMATMLVANLLYTAYRSAKPRE
ncbi:hypothetical protein LSPH26S_03308 [Lysinibacillus sphaericus]